MLVSTRLAAPPVSMESGSEHELDLMHRPRDEQAAIAWLVEAVPELGPLLAEHIEDYDEVLPYVIFESDFTRWLIARVRAGDHEPARRFVDAIEVLMTTVVARPADDPVWNLAGVAFTESLAVDPEWSDVVPIVRAWMGPHTARHFDSFSTE
jgi:hypothetical protein